MSVFLFSPDNPLESSVSEFKLSKQLFQFWADTYIVGKLAVRPTRVFAQSLPADVSRSEGPLTAEKFTAEQVAYFAEKLRHFQSFRVRLWVGEQGHARRIHSLNDVLDHQHVLNVLGHLFSAMDRSRQGLPVLLGAISNLNADKPIDLYFPNTRHAETAGFYGLATGAITLYAGSIPALYHELGHKLMHLGYQMDFPVYAGPEHDVAHSKVLQESSLAAAWTEGFANFMMFLDGEWGGAKDFQRINFKSSDAWASKSLTEKLKNEWVIARVLQWFCGKHDPVTIDDRIFFDESLDLDKVGRIFKTVRTAGIQNHFGDFLVDYVHLYPQDKAALVMALQICGLVTTVADEKALFSYPHYKERKITQFIAHYDSFSEWSPVQPNAARAKAWAALKEKGIVENLRSPAYSMDDRLAVIVKLKGMIEKQAKDSANLNFPL